MTLAELPRWETRRVRRVAADAEAFLRALRRRLLGTPGLAQSYAYRGVHFADLAGDPHPLAALDWRPGDDPGPAVARLSEATHGRVEAG